MIHQADGGREEELAEHQTQPGPMDPMRLMQKKQNIFLIIYLVDLISNGALSLFGI